MKNLVQLLVVILLAAFILPSCNSSLSITKRRYTKGYFVQHNSGRHSLKHERSVSRAEAPAAEKKAEQEFKATAFIPQPVVETAQEKKNVITAAATEKKTSKMNKAERAKAINIATKHPVKALKLAADLTRSAQAGDQALSLLWIVIVVILILYALGLLLEWAPGGLIHILALIALVLLILWLLRIL